MALGFEKTGGAFTFNDGHIRDYIAVVAGSQLSLFYTAIERPIFQLAQLDKIPDLRTLFEMFGHSKYIADNNKVATAKEVLDHIDRELASLTELRKRKQEEIKSKYGLKNFFIFQSDEPVTAAIDLDEIDAIYQPNNCP